MPKKLPSKLKFTVTLLDISNIEPDPDNPRTIDEQSPEFRQMVKSLKKSGILEDIAVLDTGSGLYRIIYGHGRYFAAIQAGLKKISAKVYPASTSDLDVRTMQYAENHVRLAQSFLDRARQHKLTWKAAGNSQSKAAKAIGMDRRQFNKEMSVLKVGARIVAKIEAFNAASSDTGREPITYSQTLQLARSNSPRTKMALYKLACRGATGETLEQERHKLDGTSQSSKSNGKITPPVAPAVATSYPPIRIPIGDYDFLDLGNISLSFSRSQVEQFGEISSEVHDWLQSYSPFNGSPRSRRLDWDGLDDPDGKFLFEVEKHRLVLQVAEPPDVAHGMALLISSFINFDRFRRLI